MLIENISNNCVLTVLWRDFYIHWQTLNEILGKDSLDVTALVTYTFIGRH